MPCKYLLNQQTNEFRTSSGKLWPVRCPSDQGDCLCIHPLSPPVLIHQLQETPLGQTSLPHARLSPALKTGRSVKMDGDSGPGRRCLTTDTCAGVRGGRWVGVAFGGKQDAACPSLWLLVSHLSVHLYNSFNSTAIQSSPDLKTSFTTSVFFLNRYGPRRGPSCKVLYLSSDILSEFN